MANITNTDELVTTIAQLETSASLPKGTVASKLDADEINKLMLGIEEAFNKLYEKLRLLEDLHDFTKRYIQNEFQKSSDAFRKMRQDIDKTEDTNQNTVVQSMTASFETGLVVTDRDGKPLATSDTVDGSTLIPANTTVKTSSPDSAVVNSTSIAYKRILTPAQNYKAFYANEQPPAEPVKETIDFVYKSAVNANFIDVSAFQAMIDKMVVTDADNNKLDVDPGTHMLPVTKIQRVSLLLRSTKNDVQDVRVSIDKRKSDGTGYIDGIKDTIYETMVRNNGGTTYES